MRTSAIPIAIVGAAAAANASTAVGCSGGLQILLARGTGEKLNSSIANRVAEGIIDRIPNSNLTSLDYPATFTKPPYTSSVDEGGAQVSTYAFCGGNGTDSASPEVTKNVIAILEFGNPTHVANATYNRGNSTRDGIFALDRDAVKRCESLGDSLRSYCDTGDTYCDLGNVTGVHTSYFQRYTDETVDFVVSRYQNAGNQSSPTTSPTGPSTTGVGGSASATGDVGGSAPGLGPGNSGMLYTAPLAVWAFFQLL
ncbi:unnamed protein product [Clonostachys rosea f. rosea IK726]|uniref:Uncharacterized protein n=1 Tax=Clonostachys rosea f. rosea IK726 TaxID=1349383 RepID=A0ACA9TUW6_BIOOC|nr:unnamed protein product [Clonostachys rosea f. rosea IK726]